MARSTEVKAPQGVQRSLDLNRSPLKVRRKWATRAGTVSPTEPGRSLVGAYAIRFASPPPCAWSAVALGEALMVTLGCNEASMVVSPTVPHGRA
jgi:hypothetical protein